MDRYIGDDFGDFLGRHGAVRRIPAGSPVRHTDHGEGGDLGLDFAELAGCDAVADAADIEIVDLPTAAVIKAAKLIRDLCFKPREEQESRAGGEAPNDAEDEPLTQLLG